MSIVIVSVTPARSQDYSDNGTLPISSLVDTFYKSLGKALFWFNPGPQSHMLRLKLMSLLKEWYAIQGLDEEKYLSVLGDNIPQAFPGALSSDSLTKTPRFATYCDHGVLFPYWNVPRSIAVNEILPLCKKGYIDTR